MSADRPPHDRRRDTHAEEVLELAGAPRELFARIHRAHPETIIDPDLASVTGGARQRSAISAPTTRTTTAPGGPADRNDTMGPAR